MFLQQNAALHRERISSCMPPMFVACDFHGANIE
jgi:hypothetical protein